jgi:hypothetical protein
MAKRVLNRLANRCSALQTKSLLKTMTKMKVMKTTTKLTFLRNAENGPMLSSASRAVEHHPDDNDERTCRIQRKCCACTHPPIEEVSCSERSADHELVRAECTARSSASNLASCQHACSLRDMSNIESMHGLHCCTRLNAKHWLGSEIEQCTVNNLN